MRKATALQRKELEKLIKEYEKRYGTSELLAGYKMAVTQQWNKEISFEEMQEYIDNLKKVRKGR